MRHSLASHIMPRTTLNLDGAILAELKRLQRTEGKTLGDLVSELLAAAIASRKTSIGCTSPFHWNSRPMGARVDIDDKEALFRRARRSTASPIVSYAIDLKVLVLASNSEAEEARSFLRSMLRARVQVSRSPCSCS
jgi:hypothetical protein